MPDQSARILVVDDEPGMRLTLAGILRKRGYQVATAEDGFQALEAAKTSDFDVVFMDVKMPGMTGVEAYVQLKALKPRAAVIMMTAYAMEDELQRALREGAFTVVNKPFDMERIWTLLASCADARPRVLVVDDRPEEGRLVGALLEQKGYHVVSVQSGWDCLQALREKPYQVVLLDVRMPGLGGMETLRKICELRSGVAVVMMTGYGQMEESMAEAKALGSIAWMRKPFEPQELLGLIEKAAAGR